MPQTNPRWLIEKAPGDLKAQVRIAVEHGYQVVSQTHTAAQLMRKKQFSCLIATVLFLCFAIPFFIYLFYYLAKKDDLIYLDIETQPSKEELQKSMKEESKKIWFAKHPIATVFIVLFGIYVIGLIASQGGSHSGTAAPTVEEPDYKSSATAYAKPYISRLLKSPSTADFCRATVTDLGESKYQVSSCVDSQNGFGATIRSNWEVVMRYTGGDPDDIGSWEAEKITFDGKVVSQ